MTSVFIFNTSEQCCAVCMSSSGLHKVYQDGTGQLCSVPSPSTVPRLLPTPQFPFSWIQTVWYLAGRGTRCIPSQQHQLKLDNTKYIKIFTNKNEYRQAGADLGPAERRQNSIILIRNSGLFFLSNLQTHFVFTLIEGSGKENPISFKILLIILKASEYCSWVSTLWFNYI